jgi:hypothetical protein
MEFKSGDCVRILTNKQGHTFITGQYIEITKSVEGLEGGDFYMARGTLWQKEDYDQPIMGVETFDYI